MEDAWEELGESYANSRTKLIGEIDCTSDEAKSVCAEFGVNSYPTLKWGDVFDLQEYEGPRDYESMKKFSDKHLKQVCSVNSVQNCDKATRQEIRRLKKLTVEQLDEEIEKMTAQLNEIEESHKSFVEGLQEKYEEENKKKDAKKKEAMNASGLTLMKLVAQDRGIVLKKKKKKETEQEA